MPATSDGTTGSTSQPSMSKAYHDPPTATTVVSPPSRVLQIAPMRGSKRINASPSTSMKRSSAPVAKSGRCRNLPVMMCSMTWA